MNPFEPIATWIEEARAKGEVEPEAMTLATSTKDGRPSARLVLCRGVDARGLAFYTNYESRKGDELAENPRAAVVFYWPSLHRQVRVEGDVERLSDAESDAYFESRPRGHRISALASAQSRPISSIDEVRVRAERLTEELDGKDVPRPAYWGGFRIVPRAIEIWTRGADRLHERVRYERVDGRWDETRLSP